VRQLISRNSVIYPIVDTTNFEKATNVNTNTKVAI